MGSHGGGGGEHSHRSEACLMSSVRLACIVKVTNLIDKELLRAVHDSLLKM